MSTGSATGQAPRPGTKQGKAEAQQGPILLLVPDQSKTDYHVLRGDDQVSAVARDRGALLDLAAHVLRNPRLGHKPFKYLALVKGGLFYAVDVAGRRHLMAVISGRPLLYMGADGRITSLGTVGFRGQIDVNRFLTRDELGRLERRLEQIVAAAVTAARRDRGLTEAAEPRPAVRRPPVSVPSVPVAPSDADNANVLTPVALNWEVLPRGWWRMRRYGLGTTSTTPQPALPRDGTRLERLTFLDGLGPKAWYAGSHLGERRYYVAVFDGAAVADTPEWGNALYYCQASGDGWRTVFRLSKAEARRAGAKRMIHDGDWQGRLRRVLGRA